MSERDADYREAACEARDALNAILGDLVDDRIALTPEWRAQRIADLGGLVLQLDIFLGE